MKMLFKQGKKKYLVRLASNSSTAKRQEQVKLYHEH